MNKTILIGLDAAEWSIVQPLVDAGVLPNIKKLIDNGVKGKIKTLKPAFSPMLWTSIATGKTADKHGILGFVEPEIDGKGVRPVNSTSRTARAIWNILHQHGLKSNVVGWWPSFPVEPIEGVMIANKVDKSVASKAEPWPIKPGSIHGIDEAIVQKLRVHPADISPEMLLVFVPDAREIDQEKDPSLAEISKLVAQTLTYKNLAVWLLENTSWDFTALYFNDLDQFSHRFIKFHPPQMKGIPDKEYKLYYNVITAVYTMYDAILGEIIAKAGKEVNVVLLSDHGFKTGNKRIGKLPGFAADIALEHEDDGFLCLTGPSFKKKTEIYGATLLDITPTILTLFGLPQGKDMDGKVLTNAFADSKPLPMIESWENVAGDFGEHDPDQKVNTFDESEAIQQLIDLGYIEKNDDSIQEKLEEVRNETKYNLSQVYAGKGMLKEAVAILESLYENDLVDIRFNLDLIQHHATLGNAERAMEILNSFRKFDISHLPNFDYLEGKILLKEGRRLEAYESFKKALADNPNFKALLTDTAFLALKLKKYDAAEKLFKKLLVVDSSRIDTHFGLSILYKHLKKYDKTIHHALEAIKIDNGFAQAHYQLGEALYRLKEYEFAAQALENCVAINPNISRSRNLLINMYSKYLPDSVKFELHKSIFQESRKGEMIIVTGLPRSGTSMMMQMLQSAGIAVLTDDSNPANEHNPMGYFDYAPAKNTQKDNSWMKAAEGKAVKVFAEYLPELGLSNRLKVIVMERDLKEVVLSQNKIRASSKGLTLDLRLIDSFNIQMQKVDHWLNKGNNNEVLYVKYKDVIENSQEMSALIADFLGMPLDEEKMAEAVKPDLYTTRVK